MEGTSQTAAGDACRLEDPIGMQAQEAIGSLILLSPEERKGLNDYGIEQCEARIQELLQVIKNPPKDRRVSDVLGQLTLLYQRRLMLEIDQRVKLQFELNDTLQTVDVLRGELTEVGNRLETIEGSQATPHLWRNGGANRNLPHRLKPLKVSHTCDTLREPAGQIWRM
ncbi:hypothetical protein ILYODFUR_008888 [Ilyodon furcidens]|uniref:Uncharacterized protein n=1 Tax=Ilyodon furcidens TaxID=33524 RepID=A0ABV0U3S9_9TELE